MTQVTEDTALIRHALAYAIELYRELTDENGAPSLGMGWSGINRNIVTASELTWFDLAAPGAMPATGAMFCRIALDGRSLVGPGIRLVGFFVRVPPGKNSAKIFCVAEVISHQN